jgi:transposase
MPQPKDDLSRSLVALDQNKTIIAVVELSLAAWLVGGIVPGIQRDLLKKLPPDQEGLLALLHRWRDEAFRTGCRITRTVVAFEAGRDGFWLARWLRARGIEAYVIHPTSIPVSREQRRAKTDRLDIGLLKRAFLGWLRGEKKHCTMVAIPSLKEDAKRPTREREHLVGKRTGIVNRMKSALVRLGIRGFNPKSRRAAEQLATLRTPEGCPIPPNTLAELERDMARLRFINEQIKQIEDERLKQLRRAPRRALNATVQQLQRIKGVGTETADMLTHEVLSRDLRDDRAVARYAGLTGSPDESGQRRREKGLAKAGNPRVRRGMIQLAWRFLIHQKGSTLVQWYQASTAAGKKPKTMGRGARPQAAHRTLALRQDWRCAARGGPAPGHRATTLYSVGFLGIRTMMQPCASIGDSSREPDERRNCMRLLPPSHRLS